MHSPFCSGANNSQNNEFSVEPSAHDKVDALHRRLLGVTWK
jgi:hypothetical protein